MKTVIVVPTLNAGPFWEHWISALIATGIASSDVYIVDSGSTDETVFRAREAGFNVNTIEKSSFNHGGTRNVAARLCSSYAFIVFMTQDAVLYNEKALQGIIAHFDDDNVAAVCGRQVPRPGATVIEAHARLYNYPSNSFVRSMKDRKKYGLKTAFLSNSFAAYRVVALSEVGGFPENVIFGEDMYVATKLLQAGYKIAYAADSCVYHSHDYSLLQEMRRYFDMGVFHSREPWIRQELGGAEGEGGKFVVSELKYLLKYSVWSIPKALLRTFLRYSGFRLGLLEDKLPLWLKRRLAMNKVFFKK